MLNIFALGKLIFEDDDLERLVYHSNQPDRLLSGNFKCLSQNEQEINFLRHRTGAGLFFLFFVRLPTYFDIKN